MPQIDHPQNLLFLQSFADQKRRSQPPGAEPRQKVSFSRFLVLADEDGKDLGAIKDTEVHFATRILLAHVFEEPKSGWTLVNFKR